MTPPIPELSSIKIVWLFAMFDLPSVTQEEKKAYLDFRKELIADGFMMMQFSVYARFCPSREHSRKHIERIRRALPPEGHVRVLWITDKQFSEIQVFDGRRRRQEGKIAMQKEQLLLF